MEGKKLNFSAFEMPEEQLNLSAFKSPDMSEAESFARGAAQEGTFGLADELEAAAKTGIDVAKSGDLKDIISKYYKKKSEVEALNKLAAEVSPEAYTAGQVTGGVASAFIPIAGQAGKLAKGASLAQKALTAAKTGAALGAATGFGKSEEQLLTAPEEVVEDVAKEAVLGATIGTGLAGAGSLVGATSQKAKRAAEFVSDLPFVSETLKAYKAGRGGELLVGSSARRGLEKRAEGAAEDLVNKLISEAQTGSKAQGAILKRHKELEIPLADLVQRYEARLKNLPVDSPSQKLDKKKLEDLIASVKEKDLRNPQEVKTLQKTVREMTDVGDESLKTDLGLKTSKQLTSDIKDVLKGSLPETAKEALTKGEKLQSAATQAVEVLSPGALEPETAKKIKAISSLTGRLSELEAEHPGAARARSLFEKALAPIEQIRPQQIESAKQKVLDVADKYDLARQISSEGAFQPQGIKGAILGTSRSIGMGTANLMGYGLSKMSPKKLNMLSAASQNPKTKDALSRMASTKDATKRAAILFGLSQSPEVTKELNSLLEEEREE